MHGAGSPAYPACVKSRRHGRWAPVGAPCGWPRAGPRPRCGPWQGGWPLPAYRALPGTGPRPLIPDYQLVLAQCQNRLIVWDQRVHGCPDARSRLAGASGMRQESATRQMGTRGRALRVAAVRPPAALRSLARGMALACVPRLAGNRPAATDPRLSVGSSTK